MNQLRALIALSEDPGLIPSTHMVAHERLLIPIPGNPMPYSIPSSWILHEHGAKTYMQAKHPYP